MSSVNKLKHLVDSYRPLPAATVESLEKDFMLRYNRESNAIEGNRLTLVETKVLLEQGVTAKGKPFRDHLDIINHQEAIYYLMDIVNQQIPLSERVIKEFNALLLKGTKDENRSGQYRNAPVTLDGSDHIPPQPYMLPKLMEDLLANYETTKKPSNTLANVAKLHADFVGIHPFIDGNGRTGRLLMNMELMKAGYPVAIIESDDRVEYYEALRKADFKDYSALTRVITQVVERAFEKILNVIDPDWQKNWILNLS